MNWEAIGAIGEVSGALAVVLTLLYLARQINESRKATIAQIYQGRADAASRSVGRYPVAARLASSLALASSEDADEIVGQLSDEEREQLGLYSLDFIIRLDNVYFQYRQGLFPEDFFDNVKRAIRLSQRYRSELGVDVEGILVSQAFRDLVRSLDESQDS